MKTLCKVESTYLSANTNFNKCETTKGCYRDKWSSNESLRFTYYLANIDDSIKYITFKGVKNKYMFRRGNMFINKLGSLPKNSRKENTIVKALITI